MALTLLSNTHTNDCLQIKLVIDTFLIFLQKSYLRITPDAIQNILHAVYTYREWQRTVFPNLKTILREHLHNYKYISLYFHFI